MLIKLQRRLTFFRDCFDDLNYIQSKVQTLLLNEMKK